MARTSTTEGLTSTNSQADQSSEKPKKSLRALLDLFTEAQQLPSAERETVLLSRCNVSNACERKQVARLFWSSMTSPLLILRLDRLRSILFLLQHLLFSPRLSLTDAKEQC